MLFLPGQTMGSESEEGEYFMFRPMFHICTGNMYLKKRKQSNSVAVPSFASFMCPA